jgi:hypothetical protein
MTIFLILLLWLPSPVNADIYQWLDNNGNRHFSDKSRPGAARVEIKPGYKFFNADTPSQRN